MKFAAIYRKGKRNWSAWVPDLPGCVTTGQTLEETQTNMHEAISLHLFGILEDGDAIPPVETEVGYVEIAEAEIGEGVRDISPAEAEAFLREMGIELPKSERDAA